MTSPPTKGEIPAKRSETSPDSEDLIIRDPTNRRSFINRSAYAKLHRSLSSGKRHSVDNLKSRFENQPEQPKEEDVDPPESFTPASFGYPKDARLKPPILRPKPNVKKDLPKDVNFNVVGKGGADNVREVDIVLQPAASTDSVDKIAKELSNFTMDGKQKKRGGFRKMFLGGLFAKDKKKKEEKNNGNSDNLKNESSFYRHGPMRHTVHSETYNQQVAAYRREQEQRELADMRQRQRTRQMEEEYARHHVDRFRAIRQNFEDEETDNYVFIDKRKVKPTINDFVSAPVNKYIDTSSSASGESERPNGVARDTPPRAEETNQHIQVVQPKAINEQSARTIERNLNKSNSKDYPDKSTIVEEPYGTVFDAIDYTKRNGEAKPVNDIKPAESHKPIQKTASPKPTTPESPKVLSLESTKLKLPPNREIYEPQPRVKSPIPSNRISTDKIIATELLKARSPTPPKRNNEVVYNKPPMSPKSPKKPEGDTIVTNAVVHAPTLQRTHSNVSSISRPTTPLELRMSTSLKLSPKKEDVMKSVEEYYWKQLKKLKEEEDFRLHAMQINGYEDSRLRRSRSLSPHRARRSLSLPRNNVEYGRIPAPQPIPEHQTLVPQQHFVYDQNFIRNNVERRSVDSLQRPIFRRGSLSKQEIYEGSPYNKRVSFNAQQVWPTRNGYVQSPPQRLDSDDEVFLQSPVTPVSKYQEPVYSNRVLEQFRAQQYRNQALYGHVGPRMGLRSESMSRPVRRPVSQIPQYEDYLRQSQLSLQHSPMYGSRQSISLQPKQVSVRNKVCDMYGQIHDAPKAGTIMGQVQPQDIYGRNQVRNQQQSFVRNSRLTASANDLGRTRTDPNYFDYDRVARNYENRPLPPPPRQVRNVSDTESGSDASEIQKIMKISKKKRSFFGK